MKQPSEERLEAFKKDFFALMDKHGAHIDLEVDFYEPDYVAFELPQTDTKYWASIELKELL
tara:strand:+ start:2403 stop:2585 length:183 start_codon:yes stop_codon:yes gene_type:complete